MSNLKIFNLTQNIIKGTMLIEASAGTGKTYSIATTMMRLITEKNLKIDEILVVTFTRDATTELKNRIRQHLHETCQALRQKTTQDPTLQKILEPVFKDDILEKQWLQRLEKALETFDNAAIFTIHSFCQRMLSQYAFESRIENNLNLKTDHYNLLNLIVDDHLAKLYHQASPQKYRILFLGCQINRTTLMKIARKVTDNRSLTFIPQIDKISLRQWINSVDKLAHIWDSPQGKDRVMEFFKNYAPKSTGNVIKKAKPEITLRNITHFTDWLHNDQSPALYDPFYKNQYRLLKEQSWFKYFKANAIKHQASTAKKNEDQTKAMIQEVDTLEIFKQIKELGQLAENFIDSQIYEFATCVRERFKEQCDQTGTQTFDDLLVNLAKPLQKSGSSLEIEIQNRFKAALIDEFQDTDELQWKIFKTIFATGDQDHYLYLIGDPKQAIYAFRGANINVYQKARKEAKANNRFTMNQNYRSDQTYVEAINHLLDWKNILGNSEIQYIPVKTPDREPKRRLKFEIENQVDDAWKTPLEIKLFDNRILPNNPEDDSGNIVKKSAAANALSGVVASDMVAFIEQKPQIYDTELDNFRPVNPGDLAVLVRSNQQAIEIQKALLERNLPAVIARMGDVFTSEESLGLSQWLSALIYPTSEKRARLLLASDLFRWTGTDLDQYYQARNEAWMGLLTFWQKRIKQYGFMTTFRLLMTCQWGVTEGEHPALSTRILTYPNGERSLTNYFHLAELLHQAGSTQRLGLKGLHQWLQQQRIQAEIAQKENHENENLEMRLETDDHAVQISTMHKSKGLEYPLVWAPYLWIGKTWYGDDKKYLIATNPNSQDNTTRYLNFQNNLNAEPKNSQIDHLAQERIEEDLRLLYVTLTRARIRCTAFWGYTGYNEKTNPLGLVLFGAPPPDDHEGDLGQKLSKAPVASRIVNAKTVMEKAKNQKSSKFFHHHLDQLANTSKNTISWRMALPANANLTPAIAFLEKGHEPSLLKAAQFKRYGVDHLWAKNSYSNLTKTVHTTFNENTIKMEDADAAADRDQDVEEARLQLDQLTRPKQVKINNQASNVPLAKFYGGAEVGKFFHLLYEHADFKWAREDFSEEEARANLEELVHQFAGQYNIQRELWGSDSTKAFLKTMRTPLGGPLANFTLSDIPKKHRLDELEFDFPVAGGFKWHNAYWQKPVNVAEITRALKYRYQDNPDDDIMRKEYALRPTEKFLGYRKLAGFMNGFIDMVFKAPAAGGEKWFIADYKSNRIDPYKTRRYPIDHFCHQYMRHAMESHNYYLQYHLYTVALHRFLQSRIADYKYKTHFGGVYYLFFRGMIGKETPEAKDAANRGRVHGCFYDLPHPQTIEKLSQLFNRIEPEKGDNQ